VRRIAVLAVVLSVLVAGCTYEDLVDFVNEAGGSDSLSSSPDPGVKAAGASPAAVDAEKEAGEKTDSALDPTATGANGQPLTLQERQTLLNEAAKLRPGNDKLELRRRLMQVLAGQRPEQWHTTLLLAPERGDVAQRKLFENVIEAQHDLLPLFSTGTPEHDQLSVGYCAFLRKYTEIWGSSLTGTAFLEFADHDLCKE
jgi:hypothetical protein